MHTVMPDIRDPEMWRDVPPHEMFAVYSAAIDRRVSAAFSPGRDDALVRFRKSKSIEDK